MSWREQLQSEFDKRDRTEQQLLPYFSAFNTASQRAAAADIGQSDAAQMDAQRDSIERLTAKRRELEMQLTITRDKLEQAQARARTFAEEQYMKTHAVQGLHDEILALTMQLSLSEDKRKKMQEELGR